MPIYAYRCGACGHSRDVLQKLSDPVLTTCPACGAEALAKQVTAAGFQLKGSGWYVTDFRDGQKGGKPEGKAADDKTADKPADTSGEAPAEAVAAGAAPAVKPDGPAAAAPSAPAPAAPAPPPAAAPGG